jgi:hypothetical protein
MRHRGGLAASPPVRYKLKWRKRVTGIQSRASPIKEPLLSVPPAGRPKPDGGAVTSVIVGAIGIVTIILSPVLGPIALTGGIAAKKRIAASGGAIGGTGIAQAAYVLGIICTVMGAFLILAIGACFVMLSGF